MDEVVNEILGYDIPTIVMDELMIKYYSYRALNKMQVNDHLVEQLTVWLNDFKINGSIRWSILESILKSDIEDEIDELDLKQPTESKSPPEPEAVCITSNVVIDVATNEPSGTSETPKSADIAVDSDCCC